MLCQLTLEQIKSLDLQSLVSRMDLVRIVARLEKYGPIVLQHECLAPPRVAQIMETKRARSMSGESQRKLADLAFRFLFQMDLLEVSSGISNAVVHCPGSGEHSWSSPSHWMRAAVLDQYQIIASRIALECFFDLIYFSDREVRMTGKSKFKAFKNWVLKDGNPYKYFVGHIVEGFKFDRQIRQNEVHGTSRFARSILALSAPDSDERNISLRLTNTLLSVWRPLIEILDEKPPTSMSYSNDAGAEFADEYFNSMSDQERFSTYVAELLDKYFANPSPQREEM